MPQREGVDLAGLLAGLRHFVDARYQLIAGRTFDAAVRAAVASIRRTRRPAALVVMNGHHVWLMTGFTASTDPARDPNFRVLSVRVVGPLYGRQSVGGYDMPPDTRLSYAVFRQFLRPYHFKFGPTPGDGRFVIYGACCAQGPARLPRAAASSAARTFASCGRWSRTRPRSPGSPVAATPGR